MKIRTKSFIDQEVPAPAGLEADCPGCCLELVTERGDMMVARAEEDWNIGCFHKTGFVVLESTCSGCGEIVEFRTDVSVTDIRWPH